jgi:ATP synthase A1 C subunit
MRSRLLTEIDYDNLLAKANIEEVITAVTETTYKNDIEAALVRVGGVRCVLEALRANLTRTLHQVREFFEGEPRTLIDILLRRWDRHNLLTILRGQSQEVSSDAVLSAVVPVGQFDEVSLRELARQPGLRAAIDLMTTWQLPYAKALRQVQPRTGTVPDLDQLELALNRFHYASLWQALSQGNSNHAIVLKQLQIDIDLINLRTALRLASLPGITYLIHQRYHAADVRPLMIEVGGQLLTKRLIALVAESVGLEEMVRRLSDTRYGPALEAGWRRYQAGEGGLTVLERALEHWQAEYIATMFTHNPLSIAIAIGYIGCKEIEVANLRLIAQAVALDMKREQVRRELIIV